MKQSRCTRIAWAALALGLPIAALADVSGTKTLTTATGALNLDTGATASSGGDLLWNGSSLTPQGTAKAFSVGPAGSLTGLTKSILDGFKGLASSAALPSSTLVVGDVFAVFTNVGNTAGVLVTANSSGSITLQFTTFGASGGGGGPTITSVTNNSSDIPAGFPNSGISQGALFKIIGSGLANDGDATLHDSQAAGGLPTTLNGATVTVTQGGPIFTVALYYATPTQIDGVMPSNTPTGSVTLTVTHNGTASVTIQVVIAAPGITTLNGMVIAQDIARPTDPYGGLVTLLKSAPPGNIITIWGSGFGATSDDDVNYTATPHATSVSYTIYIGGVQVTNIAYIGRSPYPGVTIFVLTIPLNVPTGCYVPIAAVPTVSGNTRVSNIGTLPIKAGGGVCSDPQLGFSGDQISTLNGRSTVKTGTVIVSQSTAPGTSGAPVTSNLAAAIFQQVAGSSFATGGGSVSIGGCVLTQITTGGSGGLPTGLDAGTITVTGPGGTLIPLTTIPSFAGFYTATLASIPSTGGAYVFAGSGGTQVGNFSTTVTFPNPLLSWTNQSAAATVTRSQGLSVTWTGGAPGTYVTITGNAVSASVSGSYVCIAPVAAGQFTVPAYVLLGLPAGTGTTGIQNTTNFSSFTANGLDFGGAVGAVAISVNSTHN